MSSQQRLSQDAEGASAAGSDRWLLLLRFAGGGLIATFAFTLAVVAQTIVPPLAVAAVIFAIALALTWWRPRVAGIVLGALLTFWFLSQFASASMVLPDLAAPERVGSFVSTIGMIVFPAAGTVGLVGLLRRLSPSLAVRVMVATVAILAAAVVVGVVASLIAG